MDLINRAYINKYIKEMNNYPIDEDMKSIMTYAKQQNIPILRPETAALLNILVQITKPQSALEIGSSIGFSGLVILKAMDSEGKLISVDINEKNMAIAHSNFKKQQLEDRVILINKDANDVLHNLTDKFDLIFIDGPKAQYINYLSDCIRLLNTGGLLICDDVLFYGMIAENRLINKRKITIVKRMRRFLSAITNHEYLDSTIIPIGGGVSISIKKATKNISS